MRLKRNHARRPGLKEGGLIKLDTGIGPDIAKIRHQLGGQANQREKKQRTHDHRVIAANHALVTQKPQAIQREQCFNQQRTG